jgi:hypothetical protein
MIKIVTVALLSVFISVGSASAQKTEIEGKKLYYTSCVKVTNICKETCIQQYTEQQIKPVKPKPNPFINKPLNNTKPKPNPFKNS